MIIIFIVIQTFVLLFHIWLTLLYYLPKGGWAVGIHLGDIAIQEYPQPYLRASYMNQ